MEIKRIVLVGGGSGGHVFPLMAVAESLQKLAVQPASPADRQGQSLELILLGEGKFFEEAAKKSGLKYKKIMAGKMRRYFSLANLFDMPKTFLGLIQSLWHLFWIMPDIVLVKGGYASVPPALAAKLFFIPLYIHDSDVVPGAANRLIGRWAKKVFISFETARQYFSAGKIELTGNPVRQEILSVSGGGDRNQSLQYFQLSDQLPTVLILGGSQGAQKVNEIVLQSLSKLIEKFQIIHQTGELNYEAVKKSAEQENKQVLPVNYHLYPFFDSTTLPLAYAVADVVVSRSGANMLSEIATLGKSAVIIPIKKSSANHQYYNALEFSKYGGIVIEEDNLVPSIFVDQIEHAYQNRAELGAKIKGFASPDAADKIASLVLGN